MVGKFFPAADAPPCFLGISFGPPAVQRADIQNTVKGRFHAGCTAGFHGPAGRVEPHIGTLQKVPRNVGVVVLDKNDAVAYTGSSGKFYEATDQLFALLILGVGFACKDKLNRMRLGVNHGFKPIGVCQYQVRPLVCGEATGKTDGQGIMIQNGFNFLHHCFGCVAPFILLLHKFAADADQAGTIHFTGPPQFLVVDFVNALEEIGMPGMQAPVRADVTLKEQGVLA